jgi:large subunit ribosomal protein L6
MSRVGRNPITLPAGVEVRIERGSIKVEKGKASVINPLPAGISCSVDKGTITFERDREDRRLRSLHGLTRALVANAVKGVSEGFVRELEIIGIGYRANVQDGVLQMTLGFSHPVEYKIPEGIEIKVDRQVRLSVSGVDRQMVGQVAAEIRSFRPPEPYKGKGIKYAGEVIRRKAGKAGKTGPA